MRSLQARPYWLLLEMLVSFGFPTFILCLGLIVSPFAIGGLLTGQAFAAVLLLPIIGGSFGLAGLGRLLSYAFSEKPVYEFDASKVSMNLVIGLLTIWVMSAFMFNDLGEPIFFIFFCLAPSISSLRYLYLINANQSVFELESP